MEIFSIVVLGVSGLLVFTFAGVLRLTNPVKNYLKNSGITLPGEVNILNEARGMSAVMMFGGVIIALGIFVPQLTVTSHVVAVMLFWGYAVGRLLGIVLDGKPNKQIVQGLISEIVLGAANTFLLCSALA